MKLSTTLLVSLCLLLPACVSSRGDGTGTSSTGDPESETPDPDANPCESALVRLQTGPDPNCGGGNEHFWPVDLEESDCHGWTAQDNSGQLHENSASAIQCNEDGTFSFTQYAGSLDCSGTGVTKTYTANTCEQDIPPSLYTLPGDLICCSSPGSPDCLIGVPSVSVPGGVVYLNGEVCES